MPVDIMTELKPFRAAPSKPRIISVSIALNWSGWRSGRSSQRLSSCSSVTLVPEQVHAAAAADGRLLRQAGEVADALRDGDEGAHVAAYGTVTRFDKARRVRLGVAAEQAPASSITASFLILRDE